jgi:alpha-N-arabinofuranosidase
LKHAGQYLDYVSIHGYWDPLWQNDQPSDYATCMSRALEPEAQICMTEHILAVAGFEGQIGIAFDEWNLRGWHHPNGNSPEAITARDRNDRNATYTMADAIFSAGFLNACLRHSDTVRMANMSPIINTRGPLFVYPQGIIKRTTFHVFWMYANLLEANLVDTWVSSDTFDHAGRSVPVVDAVVTCDDAMQTWSLVLINRHPDKQVNCQVFLGGRVLAGQYKITILAGDSPDAYNDIESPARVSPYEVELTCKHGEVSLSPHSVTIIQTLKK